MTNKKLFLISLGLLLINLLLTIVLFNLDHSAYEHLDGKKIEPRSADLIWTLVFGQVVSVPVFSFFIGLIVAIFVDKNRQYPRRIAKGFLLTLMSIYGLYSVMGLIRIVTFL